jgi:hypothetical protein
VRRSITDIEHELATAHHRVLDLERELIDTLRAERREVDMLRAAYEIPSPMGSLQIEYLPSNITHG